jgi:hypothetical protein
LRVGGMWWVVLEDVVALRTARVTGLASRGQRTGRRYGRESLPQGPGPRSRDWSPMASERDEVRRHRAPRGFARRRARCWETRARRSCGHVRRLVDHECSAGELRELAAKDEHCDEGEDRVRFVAERPARIALFESSTEVRAQWRRLESGTRKILGREIAEMAHGESQVVFRSTRQVDIVSRLLKSFPAPGSSRRNAPAARVPLHSHLRHRNNGN